MFHIVSCMKLKDSYNRIKSNFDNSNIEWEEFLADLDQLQDKIAYSEYDLAIVDEKIWWRDEAVSLLERRGVEVVEFKGDFEDILKLVQERIPDTFEDERVEYNLTHDENINTKTDSTKEKVSQEIKYIIQEKVVEVEKIVYKSRNIKQQIMSVVSIDNLTMRDSFSCNIAAVLSKDPEVRTLLVDITNFNNLIYHLQLDCLNKYEPDTVSNFNANTIQECVSKVSGFKNLHLLKVSNKVLTKKNIKGILFAARDYDNIIFVLESDISNLPVQFTLNLSHKVFMITEPLFLSVKNNTDIIKQLLDKGQINENIKIVLTEVEPLDKDSIDYMYKGYKVHYLNRSSHMKLINDKKLLDNKKDERIFNEILDIESSKSTGFFSKLLK